MGRPVYFEILGGIKINEIFECADEDKLVKYYIREYERTRYRFHACSRASGKLIEEGISVLDMKGISMGAFKGKVIYFEEIIFRLKNYFK